MRTVAERLKCEAEALAQMGGSGGGSNEEAPSIGTCGGARRRFTSGLCALLVAGAAGVGVIIAGSLSAPASPLAPRTHAEVPKAVMALFPVEPTSIAVVNGHLYIADPGRQEILMRSANGTFAVVAGTGIPGLSGDGGPATRARIEDPSNLVALKNGSLFFDQESVIREITPSGMISTVAGLHPSCAGVAADATSIAAESAALNGNALSVDTGGSLLIAGAPPCPLAHRLGPFLQLMPTGELADTELDSSPLVHSALVNCGPSASGRGFTAFLCSSGAGHPKELLVLRESGTTETYPTFSGGAITSTGREVIAVRDNAVVRVMSDRLQTVASSTALERLVHGPNIPAVIGLALSAKGDIFVTTDQTGQRGCTATLSEISFSGYTLHPLWERFSRECY